MKKNKKRKFCIIDWLYIFCIILQLIILIGLIAYLIYAFII